MAFLKKILTLGIICLIGYFVLGYHYIVIDKSVKMLRKSQYTLKYTFFSTKAKEIERVLDVPELWNDGIGELLVQAGKLTQEELEAYIAKKEAQEAAEY
jgi:putative lipase involved disintegration of autophagic bodies